MVNVQKALIIAQYHVQNRSNIMFCCSMSLRLGTVAFLSAGIYGSLMSRTAAIVHVPRGLETVRVSGSYRLSVQELSWLRLLHFFDITCVSVRLCMSEHQLHGFTCHVWEFHLSGAGRIVGILRPRLHKSAELTDISSAVGGNACVSWFYVDSV